MKMLINPTKLEKILSKMLLKGRYFSGSGSVNSSISNYVVMEGRNNCLNLYNGNNTTVCVFSIPALQTPSIYVTNGTLFSIVEEGECVVEISSLVTRLKSFDVESLLFNAGDLLTLSTISTNTKFTMPLTLNHPNPAMIHRIKTMTKKGVPYNLKIPYLVGKTELNTKIETLSSYMENIVKGCNVINNGKYNFNYGENNSVVPSVGTLTVSSISSATDKYSSTVQTTARSGEPATVEFSGPFFSFFSEKTDTSINIVMRDDSPIIFFALDRIILKAPFVEG